MSYDRIPEEFIPSDATKVETELGNLFKENDEESDEIGSITDATQEVTIANKTYRLRLPPDVGTLFAHRVWSGSEFLAEFLALNADQYVKNKRTVEFGAGTALPSLVALSCGSQCSVITDYPDEEILQALRETVGSNWECCGRPLGRVAVVGHEWGTDTKAITIAAEDKVTTLENGSDTIFSFDLAILSECLWMHRTRRALAQSLDRLLDAERGCAIVTYAHHVPGCEEEDDAFFDICKEYGFTIIHQESKECPYMWDSSKTIEVYLKVLSRASLTI